MLLRQFLHFEPAVAASYLLGCVGKGVCIVVDPTENSEPYLALAKTTGMQIRYVVDTHFHADHISGGRELARLSGAEYVLLANREVGFDYTPVKDGDRLDVGNVKADVLHIPGHTPEHLALVITDQTRSSEPWLVLTGHTLMVGDMGRTELATSPSEGATRLFESAAKLKRLADYVEVLPGAFAGSACGKALSGKPTSTIGFERRFNKAFSLADQAAFVELMTTDVPPPPPGFAEIRAVNMGRHSVKS